MTKVHKVGCGGWRQNRLVAIVDFLPFLVLNFADKLNKIATFFLSLHPRL
jgi:hypothetical protein